MCKVKRMDINCWQSCSGSEKGHTAVYLVFSRITFYLVFVPEKCTLCMTVTPISHPSSILTSGGVQHWTTTTTKQQQ